MGGQVGMARRRVRVCRMAIPPTVPLNVCSHTSAGWKGGKKKGWTGEFVYRLPSLCFASQFSFSFTMANVERAMAMVFQLAWPCTQYTHSLSADTGALFSCHGDTFHTIYNI